MLCKMLVRRLDINIALDKIQDTTLEDEEAGGLRFD